MNIKDLLEEVEKRQTNKTVEELMIKEDDRILQELRKISSRLALKRFWDELSNGK